MTGWKQARLSEIEPRDTWLPIRDHFGIEAFGVNAWKAPEAGANVIAEHAEETTRHEELYVVLEGHAAFTVAGEEVDAPAGTLVFVRDPDATRSAVAREAGTTVLALGAAPGQPFGIATWELTWQFSQQAMALYREQRHGEAAAVLREAIAEYPDAPGLHYNLACFESLSGTPPRRSSPSA
ncbi:MAG: AraC family ligand binding domain-containing protein [Gaiellaceae bacterium]